MTNMQVSELIEPEYAGPQRLISTDEPFSLLRIFRIEVSIPGLAREGETLLIGCAGTTIYQGPHGTTGTYPHR